MTSNGSLFCGFSTSRDHYCAGFAVAVQDIRCANGAGMHRRAQRVEGGTDYTIAWWSRNPKLT